MQKAMSGASGKSGNAQAIVGVIATSVGGLFIAQAGGSDREAFLSIGFLLMPVGILAMIIGGVAIGMRLARN